MPAYSNKLNSIVTALAMCLCSAGVYAQNAAAPLPILIPDSSQPAPWPQAIDGSTWVPVFMLGDGDGSVVANPFSAEPAGSVLLGVAQVRGRSISGDESIAISPSLRWRLGDDMQLGAAMTVTDFVPCRSLMQSPLAPVKSDACEDFAAQNNSAVGVSGSLSVGRVNFSIGYSESPAIWVLPGAIGPATVGGRPAPVLPMAPLSAIANETAQTLTVGGDLSLSAQSRMGVALAMSRLPGLENSPDIGRVQFNLAYGDFTADMASQMIRQGLETVSPWWASMDLGVSWRTPWSGIISVGARNLFSTGDPPRLGNSPSATANEADAFSRTPYVRYQQDF